MGGHYNKCFNDFPNFNNVSVLGQFFFLLLFSPHCGLYISALLHLPVNFFADTRYCEFYLIACVYFYITINILECCSGMCLPYMETD